jgi:hypothetical protein
MKSAVFVFLNMLALVGVLTVNALANILPINCLNTGQVSALYPSLFTPAGFTFSIWSIIYLLLICFVIVQWKYKAKPYIKELSMWFIVSCLANISWILAWHYLFNYASVAIMLLLLYSLTKIFQLLHSNQSMSLQESFFIKLPFTFYLSWICVATIANVSTLLVSLSWNGGMWSAPTWTILMICIATFLGILISVRFREPLFLLVLIWALFGIYSKWNNTAYNEISIAALSGIMLLSILFIALAIRISKTPSI